MCGSPLGPKRGTHSLAGEGWGGANSDEGTDSLVLYVLYTTYILSTRISKENHPFDGNGMESIRYIEGRNNIKRGEGGSHYGCIS